MDCIVCGKKYENLGNIGIYNILKCPRCGLGTTQGILTQDNDYHRDEIYKSEEQLFKNIFKKRVDRILNFKKNGTALEVGCSVGNFLEILKEKGWQVKGIEVSKKGAEIAISKGLDIIVEPFEKVKLKKKFDLIIFNHTLEHIKNPIIVLEKAYSLLKKRGLLYIDLPNFGGFSAKIYGINWSLLLPEEHIWHFSEKSMQLLLKKKGFRIIHVEKASGIWDYSNPFQEVVLSFIKFKKRFFTEVITAIPSFIVSKFGLGSDLLVIARKNK